MRSEPKTVATNQARTFPEIVNHTVIKHLEGCLAMLFEAVRRYHELEGVPVPEDVVEKTIAILAGREVRIRFGKDGYHLALLEIEPNA